MSQLAPLLGALLVGFCIFSDGDDVESEILKARRVINFIIYLGSSPLSGPCAPKLNRSLGSLSPDRLSFPALPAVLGSAALLLPA